MVANDRADVPPWIAAFHAPMITAGGSNARVTGKIIMKAMIVSTAYLKVRGSSEKTVGIG